MVRTNEGLVKGVLTQDYNERKLPALLPFMTAANSLVDDVIECASSKGVAVSDAKAELIETWLAAHFYKYAYDRQFSNKSTAGASGSYTGQTAMYLEGTTYGHTAIVLDRSLCLVNFSKQQVAGGFWMGKAPSEQIDYVDRD